jgi:ribonuclease HI
MHAITNEPDIQNVLDNEEMAIPYQYTGQIYKRPNTVVDEQFAYHIAQQISNDTPDPLTIKEAQARSDWPQWKEAINTELDALIRRHVFGPVKQVQPKNDYTDSRFTFVRKRNAKGDVIRYRARLVAKGYTQIPGRDYDVTYSPVMDVTTFRYLIAFSQKYQLCNILMDVVTAYLYGVLDSEIYMKAPQELLVRVAEHVQGKHFENLSKDMKSGIRQIVPDEELKGLVLSSGNTNKEPLQYPRKSGTGQQAFAVQVLKSINGLKQSGRIWYQKFKTEMQTLGFINNDIAPCIFIKQNDTEFVILALYVDDVNLFGTPKLLRQTINTMKSIFEMKELGEPTYCLGLQFEYLQTGIFISQSTYTKKIIRQFNMQNSYPVSTPMEMRSLDTAKDMFRRRQENEPALDSDKPYLSAIGALLYLANNTRPDISFAVSLLARHSANPTIRHWNGIKRIFRYLQGSVDMGLLFSNDNPDELIGYADAGYLYDPQDSKSQTGYVFLQGRTAISWRSTKQSMTTTSSNHAEVIALYEACREAIWLSSIINYILQQTGKQTLANPTTIYEDNKACVDQIVAGYMKTHRTKHIDPKNSFTHEQSGKQIQVNWIRSQDNCADLFTKPLPAALHRQHVVAIGMRRLSTLMSPTADDSHTADIRNETRNTQNT